MSDVDLKQQLLSWLEKQGYYLEMKVAKALRGIGQEVVQSWYYEDPEAGKSREIDVVGRFTDEGGFIQAYFVIECKKTSKPWILFTSDRAVYNRYRSFAIMTERAQAAVLKNMTAMKSIPWFTKEGRVGHGITEAFTSGDDITFKAGMAATKAAISFLKSDLPQLAMAFYFPVVVVEGPLYECYLDESSNAKLEQIDMGHLLYPVTVGKYSGSSLCIVTAQAFDRHCAEVKELFSRLTSLLSNEVEDLRKH